MKTIKYLLLAGALGLTITACDNKRNSTSIGGSRDTSNVAAGSNAGGVNAATTRDTGHQSGTDSTSHGNANPSGHTENDTTNQNKNHRPK